MRTLEQWLSETAPDVAARGVPVFEQQWTSRDPDSVARLAEACGVAGEPAAAGDAFVVNDGPKVLLAHRRGPAFFFLDTSSLGNPGYRPERLPAGEEAAELARAHLRERGWLTPGAAVDRVSQPAFEQISGGRRTRTVVPNHTCVDLKPSIGPLPGYGPGAKIKVMLGERGELIGLFHAVPRLRQVDEVRLAPREELAPFLRRRLGVPLARVEVRDERLAYCVESALSGARLVHPTYVLTLATTTPSERSRREVAVEFLTHPVPASTVAPTIVIEAPREPLTHRAGRPLRLGATVRGGSGPMEVAWHSNIDGPLGEGSAITVDRPSPVRRGRTVVSHTITATVTDANGSQDAHSILVRVQPDPRRGPAESPILAPASDDPYVGVEWCNLYHGAPGLADISGTHPSAHGFRAGLQALPGWSSRFEWGNDAAWEQDFKTGSAPGGGTDAHWADNVHFAFFAGHGSPGAFYFGSQLDDHQMLAQDARWGDGLLNWIVLHACQTMKANFMWDVWCDAFAGLHQMFGFHSNTEGSTPPLGSRFAAWAGLPGPFNGLFDLRTAWRIACTECFDSTVECSSIYANAGSTDTHNDHLPGFGHVSQDPSEPSVWVYSTTTC
jgi:hypothetical protein